MTFNLQLAKRLGIGLALLTAAGGAGAYGLGKTSWFAGKPAEGADQKVAAADHKDAAPAQPVQPIPMPGGEEQKPGGGLVADPYGGGFPPLRAPETDNRRPASPRFDPHVAPTVAAAEVAAGDGPAPVLRPAGRDAADGPRPDRRTAFEMPTTSSRRTAAAPAEEAAPKELDAPAAAPLRSGPSAFAVDPPAPPTRPASPTENGLRAAARAAISGDEPDLTPADKPAAAAASRAAPDVADEPAPRAALPFDPPKSFEPATVASPPARVRSAEPESAAAGGGRPLPLLPDRPAPAAPAFGPSPSRNALDSGATRTPTADVAAVGTPGAEDLDGMQTPTLTLEKSAPAEIQVGKEAAFQLKVKNAGRVAAHGVTVTDRVPKGTRLVSAQPQFQQSPDGQLLWQLGTIQPGDEVAVTMRLLPQEEGEIGSVAQVQFQSRASVRTVCTKPQLTLQHAGPTRVLIGETVTFEITLANPGTGAATNVVIEENVPEGLAHAAGNELEFAIGTLKPGETRKLNLSLKADKPGRIENVLLARADANLVAKDSYVLEVIAPALEVALTGPKLRYLEREATYDVAVANPGTAPAKEVELVTYLPKGMRFVSADHKGQYEAQNHAVYWSLEELPASQSGVAKLTVLPLETGEQKLRLEARAAMGLQHASQKAVQVDSLAELQFTVKDAADPIELGAETSYAITLTNTGSSASTNIRLAIGLSPQLKPLGGEGPTRVVVERGQVAVDPLARLAPGESATYKLRVQGADQGTHRIQVQLATEETPTPVTREELTRVYADK